MRVKTLDWLLAHGFPPLCFQQSIVCCAFWRYSLTIRGAPRCAVGSVTCNAVSRRCMPSIAICASRNASTLPVMLYCLRASASAISQARSVASAICKLVDIGHQFIPAGIHPGFFGAGTRGNVPFTRHIFQGLLLIYKAKGRLSGRQPPVPTENSVRINPNPCGALIADLADALCLLASTSESKDWLSLPRSVVECIQVQGVRVAKESGFD